MNLLISPKRAIELATYQSNSDFQLHGTCALAPFSSNLARAIKCEDGPDYSFLSIFGTENKFLYTIEKFRNEQAIQYERGIGYLYKQDNNIFLKRIQPLTHGPNSSDLLPCYNGPTDFFCKDGEYIIASSSHPKTYVELFADPHSILTSSDSFTPQPVSLQEDSFLARLSNSIQSLSFSSDYFINIIITCITKYTKQLILKTSKLDVKRLCCDDIQLNTNNNPLNRPGVIVFDGKDIKFFDGSHWKKLIWKIEDENS